MISSLIRFYHLVYECSDCSVCHCEVIVEKPCSSCEKPCSSCEKPCSSCEKPCKQCNKPCKCDRPPCKHCEKPCCERPPPPPPCHECSVPVEVITTVEIIETCPLYEEMIYNDEVQLIETNQTIHSTYNITENELAQQQLEAQAFHDAQYSARKGICGGGGPFGIRGDEEQVVPANLSMALSNSSDETNNNQTRGNFIAGIANHNNNRPIKPCQITSGFNCRKVGRHPHPSNCQKYVQCHFCGDNSVYECPYEQSFDGRQCSTDWSQCGHIRGCQYDRELLPDPWNESNYFICVRKKGFHNKFFVFRRFCPDDHEFDPVRQQCYRIKVIVVVKPKPPPCKRGCSSHNG